jgi:hypothetical protein
MKRLTKSIVLDVPANIIYESWKKVDPTRYTSDLTGESPLVFSKDIPNTLLVIENKGSWGKFFIWECSLRPISDESCEVKLKVDYKGWDALWMKVSLAMDIRTLMTLEYGYKVGSNKTS